VGGRASYLAKLRAICGALTSLRMQRSTWVGGSRADVPSLLTFTAFCARPFRLFVALRFELDGCLLTEGTAVSSSSTLTAGVATLEFYRLFEPSGGKTEADLEAELWLVVSAGWGLKWRSSGA
jgi:hypothetical protein